MIEATATFRRCSDARHRNIGNEGVVVRQRAGEVMVVNEIGARVLDLVEAGMSIEAMVARLETEYDVERATIERDVRAYLDELVGAGVVEPVAA